MADRVPVDLSELQIDPAFDEDKWWQHVEEWKGLHYVRKGSGTPEAGKVNNSWAIEHIQAYMREVGSVPDAEPYNALESPVFQSISDYVASFHRVTCSA